MLNRDRFRGRPGPALAAGLSLGTAVALSGVVVGDVDGAVATALWAGVAASTYYALRYGDPVDGGRLVPARTTVQVLLWLLLVRAFVAERSAVTYAVELLALGSVVLAIILSVLVEVIDPEDRRHK